MAKSPEAHLRLTPQVILIFLVLFAVSAGVYHRLGSHEFVNFDDPMFLYENSHVAAGLTWPGVSWAWTNKDAVLWQPLAWLGHMAVVTAGGMEPSLHLGVNFCLHAANAGLVFLLLARLTGATGRSFSVALLFALHPVNVETVAWASQLKSTLSTCFFLLTLLCYLWPARNRTLPLAAAGVAFALSLMAKPMLLFTPVLFFLVDWWPTNRLPAKGDRGGWTAWSFRLLPFLVLSALVLLVTVLPWTKPAAADVAPVEAPEWARLLCIPWNYVGYIRLFLWPVDLAVLYPENLAHAGWKFIGGSLVVLGASATAWRIRSRYPFVLFGWLWFLATMIPASGLLKAGHHVLADRYLYVPQIGLLVVIVWAAAEILKSCSLQWQAMALSVSALMLGFLAYRQTEVWRNSIDLWSRANAVTAPSEARHVNFGNALLAAGRINEAEQEFHAAIALEKRNPRPHINLAIIAQRRGNLAEAAAWLRHALVLAPGDARIYSNLSSIVDDLGDPAEARRLVEHAIQLRPDLSDAHLNLGVLYAKAGDLLRARARFEEALRLKPGDISARQNLDLLRRQMEGARRD